MCGIIAVVGLPDARAQILEALQKMSPRGTDSAGIALVDAEAQWAIHKSAGRPALPKLLSRIDGAPKSLAMCGLGHIRWATQGIVVEANAHPHVVGDWAAVHNGNIGHAALTALRASVSTVIPSGSTDTQVFVAAWSEHCVAETLAGRPITAATLETFLQRIEGTNAFVLMNRTRPEELLVAVQGNAELYGATGTNGGLYVVSSPMVLPGIATNYTALPPGAYLFRRDNLSWPGQAYPVNPGAKPPSIAGFTHTMEAELYSVPAAVQRVLRAEERSPLRTLLPDRLFAPQMAPDEIVFIACGSSLYAAEYLVPSYAKAFSCRVHMIDSTNVVGEELRLYGTRSLVIVLSQSGTTTDTLVALERLLASCSVEQRARVVTIGVHNNPMGALAHRVDVSLYTSTGEERATASTMAFFGQCATLRLLLATLQDDVEVELESLATLIPRLEDVRTQYESLRVLASTLDGAPAFLVLAIGEDLPIAKEAALKFKEVAYVMTEAMPAGGLKHGSLALPPDRADAIIIAPRLPNDGGRYDRAMGAAHNVLACGGHVTFFTTEGNEDLKQYRASGLCYYALPQAGDRFSQGLVLVYALQYVAYFKGVRAGNDVDNPRNLAKTVTVE